MYFAKTENDDLFADNVKANSSETNSHTKYLNFKNIPNKLKETSFAQKVRFNRQIIVTNWEKFLLTVHLLIPGLMRVSCWSKKKAFIRLFERGQKKL